MNSIQSEVNRFNGRIIDAESLASDPSEFALQLKDALEEWELEGISLVWLDLSISQSSLIPVAVELGFEFHSAVVSRLRLTRRIEARAHIPGQSTHYIGAGGAVLSNDGKLLVVSERYRGANRGRHYKLPGGALHPKEHIVDAVRREIFEETGIETRFKSLVCFRHWHEYRDDNSDIYFVCRLEPTSFTLRRQEDEIEECIWMPVDEYLEHEDTHPFNRRIVRAALSGAGLIPESIPDYGTPETHEIFMPNHGDGGDDSNHRPDG